MDKKIYENIKKNLTNEQKESLPSFQQFKKIVKYKFDNEYKDKGYKLSHVYNELSKSYGFNWNTLSAFLKENDKKNGICSNCDGTGYVGKNNKPCIICKRTGRV